MACAPQRIYGACHVRNGRLDIVDCILLETSVRKGLPLAVACACRLPHTQAKIEHPTFITTTTPAHTRALLRTVHTHILACLILTAPAMFSVASRRLPLARPLAGRRLFHASSPAYVKVGDKLPDVDLVEGSPGNKVNLAKELTGKGVIVGEPNTAPISISKTRPSDRSRRCPSRVFPLVFGKPCTRLHQLSQAERCRQSLCCLGQRPICVGLVSSQKSPGSHGSFLMADSAIRWRPRLV